MSDQPDVVNWEEPGTKLVHACPVKGWVRTAMRKRVAQIRLTLCGIALPLRIELSDGPVTCVACRETEWLDELGESLTAPVAESETVAA